MPRQRQAARGAEESLALRRVGIVAVRPLCAELIVLALNEDLSIMSLFSSRVGGIHRATDCLGLSLVRTVVLAFKADLPLSLMQNHNVLCASHRVFSRVGVAA